MPASDGGGDFVRVGGPFLKRLARPAPEAARIYAVLSELGHRLDESIKNMQKDLVRLRSKKSFPRTRKHPELK